MSPTRVISIQHYSRICWRSRRAFWLSFSLACHASSPTPAEPEVMQQAGALRQDPRTIVSNLLFIRVLYANFHLRRIGAVDLAVICTSSRMLSVRAWLTLCSLCCGWCWFIVREKYCWLAGGCWLILVWCEKKILLARCNKQSDGRWEENGQNLRERKRVGGRIVLII